MSTTTIPTRNNGEVIVMAERKGGGAISLQTAQSVEWLNPKQARQVATALLNALEEMP